MERPSSKGKMPLDEATFQRLLAAAHVLQEHAEQTRQQSSAPGQPAGEPVLGLDQAAVLAEIVETQHQILMGKLDLAGAMSLVAERICKFTGARGAAVALLRGDKAVYRAGSGSAQGLVGLELQAEATVSADTLLHGKLLRCPRIDSEFRIDPAFARNRGIQSFIAVPLFYEGRIAGVMELLFATPNAFQEQDVRTAQLMAGLLSEALARDAEERWRKDVAQERASMLEALEKIRPQLARLIDVPETVDESALDDFDPNLAASRETAPAGLIPSPPLPSVPTNAAASSVPSVMASLCTECGDPLGEEEFFCPSCGTARPEHPLAHPDDAHDQLAAALQALGPSVPNTPPAASPAPVAASVPAATSADNDAHSSSLPDAMLAIVDDAAADQEARVPEPAAETPSALADTSGAHELVPMAAEVVSPALSAAESRSWSSAQNAERWLQSLAGAQRRSALLQFWRSHGGDVSLGIAVTLVLVAVLILSVSSHDTSPHAAPANAAAASGSSAPHAAPVVRRRRRPPQPELTFFEKLLVSMGLAEAPEAPAYSGNPDITVWVDLQTALYYCPGSDMYGKTPKGKLETQRDAQMDQFEPAFRKVCE